MYKVECRQCKMAWHFDSWTDANEQVNFHHRERHHIDITLEGE